jgi:MYXO-CTERM domain-containing protein
VSAGARACASTVVAVALLAAAASAARADGAFPDSDQVLLPALRPSEIVLSTNFGLIATSDAGASWEWSCEAPLTANGRLYQLGIAPTGDGVVAARIVASSLWGAVYSDDDACTWKGAGGDVASQLTVTDVFVDRADARRVFALASDDGGDGVSRASAFASSDGGASFGPAIFVAPPGALLLGVESAASDPGTIYLALESTPGQPQLARTGDGGAHWDTIDLAPALGSSRVGIVAVDPTDAAAIVLRASTATDDRLAISRDGGAHWGTPVILPGALTTFLRRADGTLLVGGIASHGQAFGQRSLDGGATFQDWPHPQGALPHFRGLAERDGVLYAAADDVMDGFALGVSSDGGATWRPLLAYGQVTRIRPCVADACRSNCRTLAAAGLWPAATCDAPAAPVTAMDAGTAPVTSGAGCSCSVGDGGTSLLAVLLLPPLLVRRRSVVRAR